MTRLDFCTTTATSTAAAITSVGTSYAAAKVLAVDLLLQGRKHAHVVGLDAHLSSISSATTLTLRVSADTAGDVPIVPDTTATIAAGITTATVGLGSTATDRPYDLSGLTDDKVYIHFYTDAGTVTVDDVDVVVRSVL
jgi:hypothetical protein